MNKIVIVEGAQGAGKSSITTALREKMPYTNLHRMSGIKDKSDMGKMNLFHYYLHLLDFLYLARNTGFDNVFDRIFTTETVYRRAGMVDGSSFDKQFQQLHKKLVSLTEEYDISTILLIASEEVFRERIISKSDKPRHAKIEFSVENSIKQQEGYIDIWENELSPKLNPVIYITDNKPVETIVEDLLDSYIKL